MSLVTVYKHRGVEIKVNPLASSDELGYTVEHPELAGQRFGLVHDAVEAIDRLKGAEG